MVVKLFNMKQYIKPYRNGWQEINKNNTLGFGTEKL